MKEFWNKKEAKSSFILSNSIIKQHAKSFYFASKFLPKRKKWATFAVYGFCRYADNIIDNPRERTKEELINELDVLRNELELAYKYGESEHPILRSFIVAAKEYNIPSKYAFDLIDGVQMDSEFIRYNTFEELYEFCYKVASVVGLMMTYILGFKEEKTLDYAEKLGIGMQLTNILRDIKEDKEMDRIYIPLEDLEKFGLTEWDIINEKFSDNFKNMMKFQVDRAASYYHDADIGISMLDKESRFAIYSASKIYGSILLKIKERNYNPFKGRVFVPKSEKLKILSQEYIKRKLSFG
jgi:phytoene synthase